MSYQRQSSFSHKQSQYSYNSPYFTTNYHQQHLFRPQIYQSFQMDPYRQAQERGKFTNFRRLDKYLELHEEFFPQNSRYSTGNQYICSNYGLGERMSKINMEACKDILNVDFFQQRKKKSVEDVIIIDDSESIMEADPPKNNGKDNQIVMIEIQDDSSEPTASKINLESFSKQANEIEQKQKNNQEKQSNQIPKELSFAQEADHQDILLTENIKPIQQNSELAQLIKQAIGQQAKLNQDVEGMQCESKDDKQDLVREPLSSVNQRTESIQLGSKIQQSKKQQKTSKRQKKSCSYKIIAKTQKKTRNKKVTVPRNKKAVKISQRNIQKLILKSILKRQISKYVYAHGQIRQGEEFQIDIPDPFDYQSIGFRQWVNQKKHQILIRQIQRKE